MARAEELIRLLDMSPKFVDPNPGRDHIDGLEHNLRVATLARQWGLPHFDPDWVDEVTFMALVHDLARPLSDPFHGEVIAEIVRDMIDDDLYHVLRTHGQYQAALVHNDLSHIKQPFASWDSISRALSTWEERSFAVDWEHETMSKKDAVTLIYKICAGRD